MAYENKNWPVVDYTGAKVGEVTLPGDMFDVEINEYAVQRAVRVDLSNRRVDTAHTLTRDIVHGSNKKPFRQKGTGRARAGTTNSPVWRHGGVVHGPNGQQNHALKMNKKEHNLAFVSALTDKVLKGDLIVLTSNPYQSSKTKDFALALKAIGADGEKNLLVLGDYDENLLLASRNLTSVKTTSGDNVSVYDVLNAKKLILLENAVPEVIEEEEAE